MTKSRGILRKRKQWSSDEIALLKALYPWTRCEALAKHFNCEKHQVYKLAKSLYIAKSQWFKDSPMASRLRRGDNLGWEHRFKKGNVPANKGVKGKPVHPNAVATLFKKGQRSKNWRPVGSTRVDKDGYVLIKMAEGKFQWKPLHWIIWVRLNGPIPQGYICTFIDRNPLNCRITNLTLISKADHLRRQSVHSYGPEIAELYVLKGTLTKHINKRRKQDEQRYQQA